MWHSVWSCYLLSLIGDNNDEETTNQQGEKSGKKGKHPKKKNVEVEEADVGKRCQRLHGVNDLLTIKVIWEWKWLWRTNCRKF